MIAVVIPSYRVGHRILDVLAAIGPECARVFVVDDGCPEHSGALVEAHCRDTRVSVIRNGSNQGVGGATLVGYAAALEAGAVFIVKLDGDGQMDPALIPKFVAPLAQGEADYVKGNRFFDLDGLRAMPQLRLFGNTLLSFFSKASSGYWNLFDPTNGYTAIHAKVARVLLGCRLERRWFFESDVLYHLGILRAVVRDVPMAACYKGEPSSLEIPLAARTFGWKHLRNLVRRIFYTYYLRDFNVASIELVLGVIALVFGGTLGGLRWAESIHTGRVATAGTVMLAALPVILGAQLLLAFLGFDLRNIPDKPLHRRL